MLERYGVGTGVMPIGGGWRYEQSLASGGTQRIPASGCAGTDKELVEQVRQFRINAGIDMGDPELDVANYIRRESPINDRFPGKRYEHAEEQSRAKRGHRAYIDRIRDWLVQISKTRIKLLLEDEADERAEVCMKCPQNVKWKTGCLPCVEAIESRAMNVRQRASYKHDKQVGACRLHDIHVATAVFVDRDHLPELNPNAPEFCWMR